jgi:hypothetical protein
VKLDQQIMPQIAQFTHIEAGVDSWQDKKSSAAGILLETGFVI